MTILHILSCSEGVRRWRIIEIRPRWRSSSPEAEELHVEESPQVEQPRLCPAGITPTPGRCKCDCCRTGFLFHSDGHLANPTRRLWMFFELHISKRISSSLSKLTDTTNLTANPQFLIAASILVCNEMK